MANKQGIEEKKVETYARALFEAAKSQGREERDLDALMHLANMYGEVSDTLRVILEEGDDELLSKIADRYSDLFHAADDVVAVDIVTAIPLDDELRAEITAFMEMEYEHPVYLLERVDPSIIGGIIYSARGVRRDASIRTQLEEARKLLKGQENQV